MSQNGKTHSFQIFLSFSTFLTCVQLSSISPAVLRGGLVYSEDAGQGPIYLNQDSMSFVRIADTSALLESAKTSRDSTTLYFTFCGEVADRLAASQRLGGRRKEDEADNDGLEVQFSPVKYPIQEAAAVCKAMGGTLPEIRDKKSHDKIRTAAIQKDIVKIGAGVYLDRKTQLFRYISDDTNARTASPFKYLTYGGSYRGYRHEALGWENDRYVFKEATDHPLIYNHPSEKFDLRVADVDDLTFQDFIMCMKKKDLSRKTISDESNMLLQIVQHTCKRDKDALAAATQHILAEIQQFTKLNVSTEPTTSKLEEYFPKIPQLSLNFKQRVKREIWEKESSDANLLDIARPETTVRGWQRVVSDSEFFLSLADERRRRHEIIPIYLRELCLCWQHSRNSGLTKLPYPMWLSAQLNKRIHEQVKLLPSFMRPKNYCFDDNILLPPYWMLALQTKQSIEKSEDSIIRTQEERIIFYANMYLAEIGGRQIGNLLICNWTIPWWHEHNSSASPAGLATPATNVTRTENRTKRAPRPIPPLAIGIAAGLGGMAVANSVTSAVTGDAPLSWAGSAIGGLFGFQTGKTAYYAEIAKLAKALEDLKINQDGIASHITVMQERQRQYGALIHGAFEATSTIAMEHDLKAMARHIQVVQQLTLSKYANVLLAASLHKTSPYALSQRELENMARELKTKNGMQLSTVINDVHTTAVVLDGQINLIFQIPIIEEQNLFNFYRIKPMPVFTGNKTLIPLVDADYIAVSKSGSQYVKLTGDQFTRCVTTPATCQVTSPISPITTGALCVMTTYMSRKLTCPLQETNLIPRPEIHVSGNRILFSVPEPLALYVKCSSHKNTDRFMDEPLNIDGMGEAAFKPGCTVTLPDGTHFRTPTADESVKLTDMQIFKLLNTFPKPEKVTIHRLKEEEDLPELSLTDVQLPSHAQLAVETFHPMRSIPFLARLACVFAMILALAIAAYCMRQRLKQFVRIITCGKLFRYSGAQHHAADTDKALENLTKEFEKLKLSAQSNIQKWKEGSRDFLNNMGRSKSSPNLAANNQTDSDDVSMTSVVTTPPMALFGEDRNVKFSFGPITPRPILKNTQFKPVLPT